jgi:hypothetical protein
MEDEIRRREPLLVVVALVGAETITATISIGTGANAGVSRKLLVN